MEGGSKVALLVSAWIEISIEAPVSLNVSVALLVSAWIEIDLQVPVVQWIRVALLVSAWIEINGNACIKEDLASRTPRECVD